MIVRGETPPGHTPERPRIVSQTHPLAFRYRPYRKTAEPLCVDLIAVHFTLNGVPDRVVRTVIRLIEKV